MMDDMIPIVAIVSHSTPLLLTIAAIAAIALLAFPLRRWIAMRERAAERVSDEAMARIAEQAAETERLKQRVAVLERILTDRSTALADEIDRLRHAPSS